MEQIERRAFMKGRGRARSPSRSGGAEVLLTPGRAGAGRAVADAERRPGENAGSIGETWFRVRARPGIAISSITDIDFRRRRRYSRPASQTPPPYENFYRAALGAVDRATQALNNGRSFAQLNEASSQLFDNMRQNQGEGWQGPPVDCLLRAAQ